MDKNKAAYKLKGLPPIYCINLDDKPERWQFMEEQFKLSTLMINQRDGISWKNSLSSGK